ncbi:paladin-like isoform X1 [Argopecten irradians]|uniref:paladin-like isoform X1 n=1 Tax=Argopecten irradians TaxID=31199 RepID=UPI0037201F3B
MGSGASTLTPPSSPELNSYGRRSPKPGDKAHQGRNFVRTNEVAPIIIRDCREEFQHVTDFKDPIVFGSIADNMPEHPLIKGKYFLVRDVNDRMDRMSSMEQFRAPNLHKVQWPFSLYACGQPTERGLSKLLHHLGQDGPTEIFLFNMREEPVLFVDNVVDMVPFSIRDQDNIQNLVVTGRSPTDADEAEARIRKEVIDLATINEENKFYFYNDLENMQREPHEMHIQYEDKLLVSEEVYARHILCSHCVRYQRLCFPFSGAPRYQDVDAFLNIFKQSSRYLEKLSTYKPAMLFTCQTGMGRSTTAMVMGCLMVAHRIGFPPEARGKPSQKASHDKGDYRAVQRLVKLLPNGQTTRHQVDMAIEACSELYNLRSEIEKSKHDLMAIKTDYVLDNKSAKETLYKQCCDYLERYVFLIVFNAYLTEQYPQWFTLDFTQWMQQQPDLTRLMGTLSDPTSQAPTDLIFKGIQYLVSDDYVGLDLLSTQSDVRVSNFRKINISGMSVYGMAQPARDGVTKVSNHLLSKKAGHTFLALINLRNDCTLECDGTTYSVRHASCLEDPISHPHMSRQELETTEENLKKEIKNSRNNVLVYNDISDPPVQKEFSCILTPYELADQQKLQTLDMIYHRIPLQYDTALEEKDFDNLMSIVCEYGNNSDPSANTAFVFFCRTGKSRTTTAMAIAGLILCHIRGFPKGANLGEQERVSCPNAQYTKGDFIIVQKLIRMLPNGHQIKREVDFILDEIFETMSTTLFHLRENTFVIYNKIKNAKNEASKQTLKRQSLDYLERYIYLILFNAYLHYDKKIQWQRPFSRWMKEVAACAGVYKLLNNLGFYDFDKMPTSFKTMKERWSHRGQALPFHGVFS